MPNRTVDVPKPRLLKMAEVAERLGVSVRTAWSLRAAGRLKAVKVTDDITRVDERDLDAFIEQGREGGR